MACERSFIANDTLVACSEPYLSGLVLCHCGNISIESCLKLVDVVSIISHTRLFRSYPKQVGVIDIYTEYSNCLINIYAIVCTAWNNRLHFVGVDIHAYQTRSVCSNPDVSLAVASHACHTVVNACSRKPQLFSNSGVPCVGFLLLNHQCSLTVEPDVIHLVGKGLEGVAVSQTFCGNLIG